MKREAGAEAAGLAGPSKEFRDKINRTGGWNDGGWGRGCQGSVKKKKHQE